MHRTESNPAGLSLWDATKENPSSMCMCFDAKLPDACPMRSRRALPALTTSISDSVIEFILDVPEVKVPRYGHGPMAGPEALSGRLSNVAESGTESSRSVRSHSGSRSVLWQAPATVLR